MPDVLNFYIDDSGTRHPDRAAGASDNRRDWFALGGVLIRERDEGNPRTRHERFCEHWGIKYPLHSYEIRHSTGNFHWINSLPPKEKAKFFRQLERLLLPIPVLGLACVIDRPGYNARYREKYGRLRWSLCKSAFCILLERAAKYARNQRLKLRVMPEKCAREDDAKLKEYYEELRASGPPFATQTSNRYGPLSAGELRDTLYEFRLKAKSSPLIQIADLYLWPMCQGGYESEYDPYRKLIAHGRLVDCVCPPAELDALGVKYYCFDLV